MNRNAEEVDHLFAERSGRRREPPPDELLKVVQIIRDTEKAWELLLVCGVRGYFPKSVCEVTEGNGSLWLRCPAWLWEKKRKVAPQNFSERYAQAHRGVTWRKNYGPIGG